MRKRFVLAHTSGSLRLTHSIFGPTDCDVMPLPQTSRTLSAP